MSRRRKVIVGLGLAIASWALVAFAVWAPIRTWWALRRGLRGDPVGILAAVVTVLVTVPLVLAAGYVGMRRLVLDSNDAPEPREETPQR